MACIGLIGGLGVGATVHYYERIAAACKVRGVVPDLLMAHADVDHGQNLVRTGRLDELAQYLCGFIDRMARAGATAAVIPAVTPHICIGAVKQRATIPVIDIVETIAQEMRARRLRRVALLGTVFTMEGSLWGQLSGVEIVKPQAGEIISDPAAGTLGFITRADAYIKGKTDNLFELPEAQQVFQRAKAYYAIELVPDTRRLALMNALLHGIECEIMLGDTLSPTGAGVPKSDVILTNPPFGTKKGGGGPTRDDFTFPTSNKQLAFLQHVYRNLKPEGRAAVVLPDNVLFEDGVGAKIRGDLMEKCNLHTILRLPTGIFYAQGVKTNVLFFTKGTANKDKGNTKAVWVYDLRTNMPSFGKRTPFGREHLQPFVDAYGAKVDGSSKRKDEGEDGRFRRFGREEIKGRGDNLDISWLRDEGTERAEDLPEPEEIAAQIMMHLETATEEMTALMELLDPEGDGVLDSQSNTVVVSG